MAEPQATPSAEATIDVLDPVGRKGTIPASQLATAQAQGFIVDTSVADKSVYDKSVEKGFHPVVAAGISAISPILSYEQGTVEGATAGLGSGLQRKIAGVIGPVAARALGGPDMTAQEAEDFYKDIAQGASHPLLHGTGVVAGIAGSAVAGGALRGAAGTAGAVGRGLGGIAEAGAGAEAGARAVLGSLASRGALGRAAVAGASLGARGAIEAGFYTGIKELSEEVFGEPSLSASKILTAAAEGAESGALFGSILGAGGSLAASGVKGVGGITRNVLTKHADDFERMADEQRWRMTGAREKFSREAEKIPGGTRGVGTTMGEYGVGGGGDFVDAAKRGTAGNVLGDLEVALDKVGSKIGEMRDASPAMVKWGALDDAIERVAKPLRESQLLKPKLDRIEQIREAFAADLLPELTAAPGAQQMTVREAISAMRDTNIPLQRVVQQRKILDDLLFEEASGSPVLRQARERARANIEETIMSAFDDAAKASGNPGARAQLEKLKLDYRRLSVARDAAEVSVPASASNRSLGMTDYLAAAAAGGGPLGAMMALGNKFLRERGNALAATALDKLAVAGGKAPRTVVSLAEAAPMLEREVAAADRIATAETAVAMPTGKAVAPSEAAAVAPAPAAAVVEAPKFTYRKELTPDYFTEAGVVNDQAADKMKALGQKVFGDRVPDPDSWSKMWKLPEGYSVKITDLGAPVISGKRVGTGEFIVKGSIQDASGKDLGSISRSFTRDEGKLVVNHDELILDPSIQGKGIGTQLSKSALDSYHQLGVDRIDLHAGLTAGPYTWARQGYKWAEGEAERMAERAEGFAAKRGLPPEQLQGLKEAIAREPKAVADLEAGGERIGKEFLLQSEGWYGTMSVAEGRAALFEKVAEFAKAERAIKVVDAKIESAAKGIVEGGSAPNIPAAKAYRKPGRTSEAVQESLPKRYEAARKELEEAVAQQQDIISRASTMFRHMPKIAEQAAMAAMRSLAYLQSQAPVSPVAPSLGVPLPKRVSDMQMANFVDAADVVRTHGGSALAAFARGRVSVRQAQALKQVNPDAYLQLQRDCIRFVADRDAAGTPIDFATRQKMYILLGVQTDASQTPKMMRSLQENLAQLSGEPMQQEAPPPRPSGKSSMPSEQTKFDRLE